MYCTQRSKLVLYCVRNFLEKSVPLILRQPLDVGEFTAAHRLLVDPHPHLVVELREGLHFGTDYEGKGATPVAGANYQYTLRGGHG